MWFINQFDPSSPVYNVPLVIRLSGRLDVEALQAAVADVLERHESLRTVYPSDADGPVQVVLPVSGWCSISSRCGCRSRRCSLRSVE
nr:condensation domain-containing protein [Rhodococcus ruber]